MEHALNGPTSRAAGPLWRVDARLLFSRALAFAGRGYGSSGGSRGGGRHPGYSPNFRMPGPPPRRPRRGLVALLLWLVLLPPVGLWLLWVRKRFTLRGRVILTVLSLIVLGFYGFRIFSLTQHDNSFKPNSIDGAQITQQPTDIPRPTHTPSPSPTIRPTPEAQPSVSPTPAPEIYVYSVRNGAKFYHKEPTCRDQNNSRKLTLQEAISEGLKPCTRCHPPTAESQ